MKTKERKSLVAVQPSAWETKGHKRHLHSNLREIKLQAVISCHFSRPAVFMSFYLHCPEVHISKKSKPFKASQLQPSTDEQA